jgi:serine/threonine protein kinase
MLSEDYRDELDEKDLALLDLLHSMLRGEPMERPSAADLFKHPWFTA